MANGAGSVLTLIAWYVLASLITLGVYAKDKRAAQAGQWRTPESTLHLLSLAGGWPGALVALRFLRHKTKKQAFQWVLGLTVFANMGALLWLLTGFDSV
ncbi:protein of unknown function DUF1294 (plasmid) [Rhodoferax ferrireducens T118]|uniref:DUF1294 domain-containing protein n=1 Tax=Albidiferax ferrireducens (strain ATCC BAA-621 / DSM 15236 / T118) TaxID=338969 RepID=Q21QC8_ALBFT|nr:DUF1294 domain-containing protein [Rhodoferax ferrireducens]ABD72017.1 protein of unknown function DUF1294 [Rhodoferax ferrireducens T118]